MREYNKKYYFVVFETAEGFHYWTTFLTELELNVCLNKMQGDKDLARITYISKKPETYLEAIQSRNNDEEKVTEWNVSVAKKTIQHFN